MTGVEVVDGFSKKFRFSMEDAVANAVGAAFAVLVEKYPRVDALLDFRLLYQRSDDAKRVGETDPLADYSGQTFLLAAKADGVRGSGRSPSCGTSSSWSGTTRAATSPTTAR